MKRLALFASFVAAFAILSASCGTDDEGGAQPVVASDGGPDRSVADDGGVVSPYGLDVRPTNTTCLAPARPGGRAAVNLERQFVDTPMYPPTMLAQIPGDKSRIFLAAIHGEIFSFSKANPPTTAPPAVLTLPPPADPTSPAGQITLLGFAFHPKFAQNGRIFLSFTTDGGSGPSGARSVLARMRSADGGTSFGEYTELISYDQTGVHNGGGIAFGNDGSLFVSFGDGGDGDDTYKNGQTKTGFFSKIIRIDVDSPPAPGLAYAIPNGNPFKGGGGEPATWAYGFRNPFRISVDRASGDLWVGDVGEAAWEEVDRITAPGGNYGWPCREGAHDHILSADRCPNGTAELQNPIFEYAAAPAASVTGGVVYRGSAIPSLVGTYVFGDYVTGTIRGLDVDPLTGGARLTVLNPSGPTGNWVSFSVDDDGEIYAVDLDAKIYKLVAAAPLPPSTFPDRLSKLGCFDAADAKKALPPLIPYDVNAPQWTDGATKQRWLALPDRATIARAADGDLDLPMGAMVFQTMTIGAKPVETRMLVRHADDAWAGYSYEWNDEGTDAVLLPSNKATAAWSFPGRDECLACHTKAAGSTIALEVAQLNREVLYPTTGRVANQLATLEHIGMFSAPLGAMPKDLPTLPNPLGAGAEEPRARAHLHTSCASCHRPDNAPNAAAAIDLRFTTALGATKICNVSPAAGTLGVDGAKLLLPGAPEKSLVLIRMRSSSVPRMPSVGSRSVDTDGALLVERWIKGLAACPP